MLRLTLRTLLAYLDDTLNPADARAMGHKVAENPTAQDLVERIRRVTRKRGLSTPPAGPDGGPSDPNTVAEYLSDSLIGERVAEFEHACLENDVHLAEVAACHQILTMVLSEPVRVPPTAHQRMYHLVKGRESIPNRKSGHSPAVGGVGGRDENGHGDPDDTDAPLLLGLAALSRSGSRSRRLAWAMGVTAAAAAFTFAVWWTLPPTDAGRQPEAPLAYAALPVTKPTLPSNPTPTPPVTTPTPPETTAKPNGPEVVPPPRPVIPTPMNPKEPPGELAPAVPAPRADAVPLGKWEREKAVVVLLRKKTDDDSWSRVSAADPAVQGTDRLLSLPGSRAAIQLDTGLRVDLWGNLPELFPSPLLASSATFYAPAEGFVGDLAVYAGRIYLQMKKPSGGKVRLRFADQVWDVTLPNESAEVAFELVPSLTRGNLPEPPQASAALAVVAGHAGLTVRYKDIPQIGVGEAVFWDNKGRGLQGPKKLDTKPDGKPSVYFARFPLPPNGRQAQLALEAIDDISKRLTDPTRTKAVLAELSQERAPTERALAGARVGILCQAAIGDLPELVDALGDLKVPNVRRAAVEGLQFALAVGPDELMAFRKQLIEKSRLNETQADLAVRLMRGFTESEKKNPATLDRIVEALSSDAIVIRELAFMNLMTEIDPDANNNRTLAGYDAGATDTVRESAVRAWKARIEELKKKAAAPESK